MSRKHPIPCPVCGKEFIPSRERHRTCSERCRIEREYRLSRLSIDICNAVKKAKEARRAGHLKRQDAAAKGPIPTAAAAPAAREAVAAAKAKAKASARAFRRGAPRPAVKRGVCPKCGETLKGGVCPYPYCESLGKLLEMVR